MKSITQVIVLTGVLGLSSAAWGAEKDCLLEGTVVRDDNAGQGATSVQIHSVKRYEEDSRCKVRRGQKMEFKLPADSRVQEAPSGSAVKYRYRTDESGKDNAELISVGA